MDLRQQLKPNTYAFSIQLLGCVGFRLLTACPSPRVRCRDDGSINVVRPSRLPGALVFRSSLPTPVASFETCTSTGSLRRRWSWPTTVSLCRQPRPSPFCSAKVSSLCTAARPGRRLTLALFAVLFQDRSTIGSGLADYFRCYSHDLRAWYLHFYALLRCLTTLAYFLPCCLWNLSRRRTIPGLRPVSYGDVCYIVGIKEEAERQRDATPDNAIVIIHFTGQSITTQC